MVTAQDPGGEGLRGGQKNGLDLCKSNNFISMGEIVGVGAVPSAAPCSIHEK